MKRPRPELGSCATVEKIMLILFKEVISVYFENHLNPGNVLCGQGNKVR
jgi:hypothetical protein